MERQNSIRLSLDNIKRSIEQQSRPEGERIIKRQKVL
jgi:hypothetical protein